MKEKIFYLFVLLSAFYFAQAQEYFDAGNYSRLEPPCSSAQLFLPTSYFSASCCNQFLLKETTTAHAELWLQSGNNGIALAVEHQGGKQYGELKSSIAYGRLFGEKIGVSLRFHYLCSHAEHYTPLHSLTFDLSLFAAATQKLFFGFEVFNPARLKYNFTSSEVIPMKFSLWSQFKYSDKLVFSLLIFKQLPGNFDIGTSAHYAPLDFFAFSFNLSLTSLNIGALFRCHKVYFKIDVNYNYRLGISPKIGIYYQFEIKKTQNKKNRLNG